jgi:hypothetical protein
VGLSTGLPGAAALAAAFFAVAGVVFAAAGAVVAFGRRLRAIVVHRSLLVLICALMRFTRADARPRKTLQSARRDTLTPCQTVPLSDIW